MKPSLAFDFQLTADAITTLRINDLQVKAIKISPDTIAPMPGLPFRSKPLPATNALYEALWQVDQDFHSLGPADELACVQSLLLADVMQEAKVPICVLEALQQALSVPKGYKMRVQLQSNLHLPLPAPGMRVSAAVQTASMKALLKVAATELPGLHFQITACCEWDADYCGFHGNLDSASIRSGRTFLEPRLLHQTVGLVPLHAHVAPHPRGSLANMKLVPHGQAPATGEIKVNQFNAIDPGVSFSQLVRVQAERSTISLIAQRKLLFLAAGGN